MRPQMLADVLGSGAVVDATRRLIRASLDRQAAVCTPNEPGEAERRRRAAIGTAEGALAQAERDLVTAVRKAADALARKEIQP